MVQNKKLSPQQLGWVCAFVAASAPLTTSFSVLSSATGIQGNSDAAIAAPLGTSLMASIPADLDALAKRAKVKIASSNSMLSLNEVVRKQFTSKYGGSSVELEQTSAKKALEEVAAGKADLAAIGRPLTSEEKAQGLVAKMIGRDKIAVVITPGSSFKKDLTIPKFAKMFRGEITDWAQLGGTQEKITFIDRVNSDTRQALAGYPAFKNAPLDSGKNAVKLEDTSMKALVENLKGAAVSFVPANQAKVQSGMRTLTMHGVLPTDARYPFSQPLYYVYKNTGKGDGMSNDVKAFLGYLSTEEGQNAARTSGIAQIQKPGPDKADVETKTEAKAAKLDSKAGEKGSEKIAGTGTEVRPAGAPSGLGNKASRTSNQIAAEETGGFLGLPVPSWLKWLLPLGLLGTGLLLLLLPNKRDQAPKGVSEGNRDRFDPMVSDRPSVIGGASDALSNAAKNTTEIVGGAANAGGAALAGGAAAIGGLAAGAAAKFRGNDENDLWNESDGAPYIRDETDVNGIDRVKDAAGNVADGTTRILGDMAGAGGAAAAGAVAGAAGIGTAAWNFLKGKGSEAKDVAMDAQDAATAKLNLKVDGPNITVPPVEPNADFSVEQDWSFDDETQGVSAAGLGATAAAGAAMTESRSETIGGTADAARTRLVGDRAGIVIIPQNAREAVVRWQVSEAQKRDAKQQGGTDLALRLYDVTGINPDSETLENFYQYDCNELTQELRIEVPVPARDYVVEVGYVDRATEWYGIARSLPVHIPAA